MSGAIPWKLLQKQYFADHSFEDELATVIERPEQVSCNFNKEKFESKYP